MPSSSPDFWEPIVRSEERADGSILVWREDPLGDYPRCLTERFMEWAVKTPDVVWMAERNVDDTWQKTSYAEGARQIASVGSALLELGLSPERPLAILSGNSVAHAVIALGAQHVGIPSAAISPAYALASGDFGKLRDVVQQLTPGAVFVDDTDAFAQAISEVFPTDTPVIAVAGTLPDHEVIPFSRVAAHSHSAAMRDAHAAITPDTVAKFLFTSGTTGSPKAVIQTQRILCANQKMVSLCYPFMQRDPPVVVDWAPWNHTASGNKVFNMVIYNGGTFYIDDGRPSPNDIAKTVRNLREISPTWYFNVPLGYQMLLDAMENDAQLRTAFFSKLKIMMYAGAGMSQPVWDRIARAAADAVQGGVLLATGFGSTETGPFALMCTTRQERSGNLGVPAPGVLLKLVPQDGKYEARIKGPSITPGYWRAPQLAAEAFDDEGFYRFGDAFRFAEPANASAGFYFDGRLAENFKLASGTWVAVGALRTTLANDLGGLASDVVIAGEGKTELGALIVPDWAALRELAQASGLDNAALASHPAVRRTVAERLGMHAARATGSATRVTRVILLDEPLSFDLGEVTDKGSINQRAVLRHRADLVEELWSDDPRVIHMHSVK